MKTSRFGPVGTSWLKGLWVGTLLSACAEQPVTPAPLQPQLGAAAYTVQDLGTLPGDDESFAAGVSADGTVVVGSSTNAAGGVRAFRWTPAGGMKDLGALPGTAATSAYAVSADGSVVVGQSGNRAFRWTAAGGMQALPAVPGAGSSAAYDVSADGSVAVGESGGGAVRWPTPRNVQPLAVAGASSSARGVSADGSVVAGFRSYAAGAGLGYRAFRWTAGGVQDLVPLYAPDASLAYGVSADGRTVVGYGSGTRDVPTHALLWNGGGAARDLTPSYGYSTANAVNPDGSVVVGGLHNPGDFGEDQRYPFVWTALAGVQRLGDLTPEGSFHDSEAADVSANGSAIVGRSFTDVYKYRAVRWTRQQADSYTLDLEQAPLNRVLWTLSVNSRSTPPGPPHQLSLYGLRRIDGGLRRGNQAKAVALWGGKRLTIVRAGTNLPNPEGGRLRITFSPLGDGLVTAKRLTVYSPTGAGALLELYRGRTRLKALRLPRTAPGQGTTIPLQDDLSSLTVDAKGVFAVDDLVFENPRD